MQIPRPASKYSNSLDLRGAESCILISTVSVPAQGSQNRLEDDELETPPTPVLGWQPCFHLAASPELPLVSDSWLIMGDLSHSPEPSR